MIIRNDEKVTFSYWEVESGDVFFHKKTKKVIELDVLSNNHYYIIHFILGIKNDIMHIWHFERSFNDEVSSWFIEVYVQQKMFKYVKTKVGWQKL